MGYRGSGPAQLALALLIHSGMVSEEALKPHQRFNDQYIAPQPHDGRWLLDVDVVGWARSRYRVG